MGFYGNITNVSRTQFQFDKIYPNRKAMEQAKITDGIYLGRYVLVEYDNNGLDGMKEVIIEEGQYYYGTPNNKTLLTWQNTYINEVVYTTGNEKYIFYKRNEQPSDASDNSPATFTQFTSGNEDTYGRNYAIDNDAYKSSRGYDSTVWQKVYSDEQEKYVMIAELNTVVPKFDITADAPTMTPVTPHFDTQSTDIYYKLHMQNPWIVRVAEAKNGAPSDAKIEWQEVVKDENKEVGEQYEIVTTTKDGAIYFNKAAFDSQVGKSTIAKKADGDNKITIDLVSSGLELYDDHNNTTNQPISADDIQELTINLPAIGNMMSDAWDIIHGPNRDNSMAEFELNEDGSKKIGEDGKPIRTDSLQGRLNSIAAMNDDEIPVKRGSDGALIGATINGGKTSNSDLTGKNDDAWIETMVNGNIESITIKHTFNKVNDINTESNKNIDQVASDLDSDKIDLYTPIVDVMGHVVGKNTETVTLPYGFKTISVANKSESTSGVAAAAGNVVADNTQDTLTLTPGNKWIHITADISNDTVTISHEVNSVSSDEATTDWTKIEANTTIPVVTYDYDEAGHYTKHHTENYQLPFGYGKIKGDSGDTAATATYDELTFASDEWLTATVTEDKVTYSHDTSNPNKIVYTDKENQYPSFGSTFTIEDWAFDEKGHQFNNNKSHTVTIPGVVLNNANDGNVVVGLALSKATEDNNKTATFTESKVNVGNLALTDYSVVSHTNANGSTDLQPQDTINGAFNKLQTQIYEEEVARANETSRAQGAEKALNDRIDALDYSETADNTKIITQITQVDGKITNVARAAAGTLALGSDYFKSNESGAVTTSDSLNSAIGKLEKNIEVEIEARTTAVAKINERIDTLLGGENINQAFDTIKEIADWLGTNDSGADKVIDDIATLNGDSDVEGSVDYKIKTQVLDEFGSAARSDITDYATAAQGAKADSAVQSTTTFTYNEEQKTIAELFSIVAELSATVVELQNELNTLKEKVEKEHPTPIEPETPTEPENPETNE